MSPQTWLETRLPLSNSEQIWELFHENSKIGRLNGGLSESEIRTRMRELRESLEFTGYPFYKLGRPYKNLKLSLAKAILTRISYRSLTPRQLSRRQLATLLHYAYGINRDNRAANFPRPFRVVPSGGALYPLELFFYSNTIAGLLSGLYHYSPTADGYRLIRKSPDSEQLAQAVVFPDLIKNASLVLFITAIFERSVFKYGERGYRFALLEAGHVAQNVNLVANALGLASVNIGGFFDREVDSILGLDGVTHSTLYLIAIAKKTKSGNKTTEKDCSKQNA
jgi:SagB-type dehydrogenase family enzyme